MRLRKSETGDGTRFALLSPADAGEYPARGARLSPLRKLLLAWSLITLFFGSAFLGGTVPVLANPPYVYVSPAPLVASPAVSVQPGVIFSLPAAHVNITFANGVSANSNITLPGYGKSLTIDSYNITVGKSPATYPGISMNFTTWNPAQNVIGGAVAVASVVVPSGTTTLYLNLSGLTPNVFVFPLVDGAAQGGVVTNPTGYAPFSFWDWKALSRTIEIDVGQVKGGLGVITPRIFPSFAVSRFFDMFNASSDEWVRFHDTSGVPQNTTVSRAWKFGDGMTVIGQTDPFHHYDYSLSATFNVSLVVCAGNTCNVSSQRVTMVRWHTPLLAMGILIIGVAGLVAVWRARKSR